MIEKCVASKKLVKDLFYGEFITTFDNKNEEIRVPGIFCNDIFKLVDGICQTKATDQDVNFVAKISIDSGMHSLKICIQILDEADEVQEPVLIVALADVKESQAVIQQMFDEIDILNDLQALTTIYNMRVVFCHDLKINIFFPKLRPFEIRNFESKQLIPLFFLLKIRKPFLTLKISYLK